jgi:hypothetical protein
MIKFEQLWKNFPDKGDMEIIKSKCTNKQKNSNKPFPNYCAILLSECFIKSGIDTNIFNIKKQCWSHSGKKHILLAEDLAIALKARAPNGFSQVKKINSGSFQSELSGKTGVIFFKDYWQRGRESFDSRSGDHIDLWNKDEITSSGMFIRSLLEFLGRVSDLNKSREIWFWEIK